MSKFLASVCVLVLSATMTFAGDVFFVSYDKDKKELKVKASKDDKDARTYKLNDKTVFKNTDKELKTEAGWKRLEALKEDAKLELTLEKDTVTEVKFTGKKKDKSDKS